MKKTIKPLKLYVWEDALADWHPGIMFALAPDRGSARKMLLEMFPDSAMLRNEVMGKPTVVTEAPYANAIWGSS